MNEQNQDLQNTLNAIDEQTNNQPPEKQETAEQRRLHYMTDEERREWSGVSEWHDPLEKEKAPANPNDGKFALTSLLCGIASVLMACVHISSVLLGIAAIVFAIIAKKKNETAHGMIKAGIILGCICLGIFVLNQVLWILGRMFPVEISPDQIIGMPGELSKELAD